MFALLIAFALSTYQVQFLFHLTIASFTLKLLKPAFSDYPQVIRIHNPISIILPQLSFLDCFVSLVSNSMDPAVVYQLSYMTITVSNIIICSPVCRSCTNPFTKPQDFCLSWISIISTVINLTYCPCSLYCVPSLLSIN